MLSAPCRSGGSRPDAPWLHDGRPSAMVTGESAWRSIAVRWCLSVAELSCGQAETVLGPVLPRLHAAVFFRDPLRPGKNPARPGPAAAILPAGRSEAGCGGKERVCRGES